MSPVKSYLRQVSRSYQRYQRKVGVSIPWYEFDPASTTSHPIYDEGPERVWHTPKMMPILSVVRDEARQTPREEGLYALGTIHLAISAVQAARAGITDPYDAETHLNDRFGWDDKFWEVRRWQISGRLRRTEVVIGVDATQVADEETVNDAGWPPT